MYALTKTDDVLLIEQREIGIGIGFMVFGVAAMIAGVVLALTVYGLLLVVTLGGLVFLGNGLAEYKGGKFARFDRRDGQFHLETRRWFRAKHEQFPLDDIEDVEYVVSVRTSTASSAGSVSKTVTLNRPYPKYASPFRLPHFYHLETEAQECVDQINEWRKQA